MLQKIIHQVIWQPRAWRDVGYQEINGIFSSPVLGGMPANVIGLFIPAYGLFLLLQRLGGLHDRDDGYA